MENSTSAVELSQLFPDHFPAMQEALVQAFENLEPSKHCSTTPSILLLLAILMPKTFSSFSRTISKACILSSWSTSDIGRASKSKARYNMILMETTTEYVKIWLHWLIPR
jgi:hypothetical protein